MTVYPSDVMYEDFGTSNPMYFALVAIAIFLITSAVFIFYDCMVERRQKVVLSTAIKTSAIVSSLFPTNVRDQLLQQHEEKVDSPQRRLKTHLKGEEPQARGGGMGKALSSRPLAELFDNTTVFVGDVAGFTAWRYAPCADSLNAA